MENSAPKIAAPAGRAAANSRCLTFVCGGEKYALDILIVREIVGSLKATRIPRLPPALLGVTNLRGRLLPVFDFARLVGLAPSPVTDSTCTIVIAVGDKAVGMVVDRVLGVMVRTQETVREIPDVDVHVERRFLEGIAMFDDIPHFLLGLDELVCSTNLLAAK